MASFISPVRPIDTAPPWGWNPGETFVTAFNESRLAQQKAEEMRLSNELEAILLPVKQKQAALALDKMQFEVELQSARLDQERIATKQAYRSLKDSVSGSNVAGNGGSSNQAPAEDATSFNLTGTVYDRTQTAQSQPQTGSQPVAKTKVDLTGI